MGISMPRNPLADLPLCDIPACPLRPIDLLNLAGAACFRQVPPAEAGGL
jgi:hypothetical protein